MVSAPFSALVGVNKPVGLTSHDVVNHLRHSLGVKRIGHAGTLDPGASGVLIMGVGQATRLLGLITLAQKSYLASFVLGSETTTDDAEGEVVAEAAVSETWQNPERAAAEVQKLVGTHQQIPPQVSAISKEGKRAWKAFKEGSPLELAARDVRIYDALLVSVELCEKTVVWNVALTVSKGCYVRALARDLGRALGCYGHIGHLVRTKSGPVSLGDCVLLSDLERGGWEALLTGALDPLVVAGLQERDLQEQELTQALAGRSLMALPTDSGLVGLVAHEKLWGVWEVRDTRLLCKANFPEGILRGSYSHG